MQYYTNFHNFFVFVVLIVIEMQLFIAVLKQNKNKILVVIDQLWFYDKILSIYTYVEFLLLKANKNIIIILPFPKRTCIGSNFIRIL